MTGKLIRFGTSLPERPEVNEMSETTTAAETKQAKEAAVGQW
jgi:hypothetical protein